MTVKKFFITVLTFLMHLFIFVGFLIELYRYKDRKNDTYETGVEIEDEDGARKAKKVEKKDKKPKKG